MFNSYARILNCIERKRESRKSLLLLLLDSLASEQPHSTGGGGSPGSFLRSDLEPSPSHRLLVYVLAGIYLHL